MGKAWEKIVIEFYRASCRCFYSLGWSVLDFSLSRIFSNTPIRKFFGYILDLKWTFLT